MWPKNLRFQNVSLLYYHSYEILKDQILNRKRYLTKSEFLNISKNSASFNQLLNKNIHKNGNIVYIETSGVPIFNKENIVIGYRGTDRDVTKRGGN